MWDDARQLNAIAVTLDGDRGRVPRRGRSSAGSTRLPAFDYREVVVTTPLARASGAHLEAVIRGELRGTFFTMDLDAARASLARVPWVRAVALRRQWPRRLEIEVDEHAAARALERQRARQHARRSVRRELGRRAARSSTGPTDSRGVMIAALSRVGRAARAAGARALRGLRLSPRGGWQVRRADDDGRADARARPRRRRRVASRASSPCTHAPIGVLARAGKRVDHVDLRYRNGFAARMPGFREKPPRKVS